MINPNTQFNRPTFELFTADDIINQIFDVYGVKIGIRKDLLFLIPFYDNPEKSITISDKTTVDDFINFLNPFINKFAFVKPVNELNKDHILHYVAKSVEGEIWSVVYSSEKAINDYTAEEISDRCNEFIDGEKYSEMRIIDFSTKEVLYIVRNMH